MSVMAETSQSAMSPYLLVAVVGLASYSTTAVFRAALSVNVVGQVPPKEAQSEP